MNTTTITDMGACLPVPPWYPQGYFPLTDFPFMTLQLQLVIVFFLTQGLHYSIFSHFGLPPLVSEMMAGILLSPKVFTFGKIKIMKKIHSVIFPKTSEQLLEAFAMLGFALSQFIIGVKMDFSLIRRNGLKPFVIGILALAVPLLVNTGLSELYSRRFLNGNEQQIVDFTGISNLIPVTSFPVIVILLSDLKLLNSELGRLALSCASVSEVASIFLILASKAFAILASEDRKKKQQLVSGASFGGLLSLLLVAVFVFRPFMNWIVKQTPKGRPVKTNYLIITFLCVLIAACITNWTGEFVMLGCFIIGAAVPVGPPLGSSIANKFDSFISGILQPFFITTSVMKADLSMVRIHDRLACGRFLVTLSAFSTKISIILACGMYYNLDIHDALALAAVMSSKGLIDLAAFSMFREDDLIGDSSYAYLVVLTTILAIAVPIAIKGLYHPLRKYAGYEKRDVMHCRNDTPLRILACICRSDNVSPITNHLTLFKPTKDNPLAFDVLHLTKLIGRSQPIFIAHDVQKKASSHMSYSEDIIWAFDIFKQTNQLEIAMRFFTAVSSPQAMHEDICTLALNRSSSLIILPFHRKLSINGCVDFEDRDQRALNNSVLERAPCSIGILVNRGTHSHSKLPSNRAALSSVLVQHSDSDNQDNVVLVAVIFIGGKDDREAVAYARRMARGKMVRVQIIRLIAIGENSELGLLDSSALLGIREYNHSKPQFSYTEKMVRDGSETAKMMRSIIADYDLVIVGRRFGVDCTQTSGLKEWSEAPELGIIGDLLASPDIPCRTSVLVVQQQKQWTWKDYNS